MTVKAFISTPLETVYVEKIRSAGGKRVEVVYEPDLLPDQRYVADHKGAENFTRNDEQLRRWLKHLATADFLWDIPPLKSLPSNDGSWAPKLKWVQTTSSGVGPLIETLKFKSSNILVTTAKGVHAAPLSEYVMMMILNHIKRYDHLQNEQSKRRWKRYCGESLQGKCVSIIGAGEVGDRIAKQCKNFGMYVSAMSRTLTKEEGIRRGYDRVFSRKNMKNVMAYSDVVVLCVPHTAATERMIDKTTFGSMKRDCLLVNIARGQVIDEEAMIEALISKKLGAAALDVTTIEPLPANSPLWDLPNVFISPHSASTVREENGMIVDIFIHNMKCMLNGTPNKMKNKFNFSEGY